MPLLSQVSTARSPSMISRRTDAGAAGFVEVSGDLVEQQQGRHAIVLPRDKFGMGEHQTDQQCLLLARGTQPRRRGLGAVFNEQIGTVRAFQRASSGAVTLSTRSEEGQVSILDVHGGAVGEVALQPPFERQPRPGEWGMRVALATLGDGAGQRREDLSPRRSNRDTGFRHQLLQSGEAAGIAHTVLE